MTDSTAALQAQLSAQMFISLTEDVQIDHLVVPAGATILGNGNRIISTNTSCAIQCVGGGTSKQTLLSNFHLMGNGQGLGAGISIEHAAFHVENVTVGDSQQAFDGGGSSPAAYDFDTCFDLNYPHSVDPSRLVNCAGYNYKTQGLLNRQGNDVYISGCLFASNARTIGASVSRPYAGMNLAQGSGKIQAVHCYGGSGYGAIVGGGDYCLRDCHFEGSSIACLLVTGAGATITGCHTFLAVPDAEIPTWKSWGYSPMALKVTGELAVISDHIFGHLDRFGEGWLPFGSPTVDVAADTVVNGIAGKDGINAKFTSSGSSLISVRSIAAAGVSQ